MEKLIEAFALFKSYGAIVISLHGCIATITFKSANDAFAFRACTPGAEMDSELTVRVSLNEYLRFKKG